MSKDKKELTTMEAAFLEHLAGEAKGNIKLAMKLAGYSDNISTTQIIRQLKQEMIEVAQEMLAANAMKAVSGLDDVLDSPNSLGAKNKIAAAKEILDRAGIVKPQGELNLSVPDGGLIILPAKGVKKTEEVEE